MSDPDDNAAPTPAALHTLAGVWSRIRETDRTPTLEAKLGEAFAKHADKLLAYCRRELRGLPEELAQETTQDVLLEAWNKLPTYEPVAPFRSFLWAIARLKCANVRRKRRDRLTEDGVVDPESEAASALAGLEYAERNALIEEAARNVLDAREQDVVQLRWVQDYPYDEIIELLGIADREAVRITLVRCKRRLEREIPRLLAERGLGTSFLG